MLDFFGMSKFDGTMIFQCLFPRPAITSEGKDESENVKK